MQAVALTLQLLAAQGTPEPKASPLDAEVSRLEGQTVRVENGSYEILDIAGEGPPRVGCVHKDGNELVLVGSGFRLPLRGPLAVPRIAGPRYKVWVIGTVTAHGALVARRLGILAGPDSCPANPGRPSAN